MPTAASDATERGPSPRSRSGEALPSLAGMAGDPPSTDRPSVALPLGVGPPASAGARTGRMGFMVRESVPGWCSSSLRGALALAGLSLLLLAGCASPGPSPAEQAAGAAAVSPPPEPAPGSQVLRPRDRRSDWIATALLKERQAPDPRRLEAALRSRLVDGDRLVSLAPQRTGAVLRVAGGTAVITFVDATLPADEVQDACRNAWYWPQACASVDDHKAQAIVMLTGTELDRIDSALLQTRLMAAVLDATRAVAVLWGQNLQFRDSFLAGSIAPSRDALPVTLWVNHRLTREASGRLSIATRGLKAFDLMEIEARDSALASNQLFDATRTAAQRLLRASVDDAPIVAGAAAPSATADPRLRVADSYWNPGQRVWRLAPGS